MTEQNRTIASEIIERVVSHDPKNSWTTMTDILGHSENVVANTFMDQVLYWDYVSDPEVPQSGALVLLSFQQLLEHGRTKDEVFYEMATYALPGDYIHVITNGMLVQEILSTLDEHDLDIFTEDQFSILSDAVNHPDDESFSKVSNALALRLITRAIIRRADVLPFDFGQFGGDDDLDIPEAPKYEPEF